MVYSPILEHKKDAIEGCDAPIDLQNKEQILSCIENTLTNTYDKLDEKRRKNYEDLRIAIQNKTLRATLSLNAQTKQMSCVYTAQIGDELVEIMRCCGGISNVVGGPFSGYTFGTLEVTWGDGRNRFDGLFSYVSSGRRYPTLIPRDSEFMELQSLLQNGCMYALYDNEAMHAYITSQQYGNEQVAVSTAKELIDVFNKQPSLEGAYQAGGSWYYKYGLQELGPYKQAVENEKKLAERVQSLIHKNVVSLGCGTNDELERKIVQITLGRHELLISLSPVFLTAFVDLVLRLCDQPTAGIERFYGLSALITFALAKILPHVKTKGSYLGIDTDATSTSHIKQKLQETQQRREVLTLTKDIFGFLSGDNEGMDIIGPKTFSIPGGTYGNFDGAARKHLTGLLDQSMEVGDNVYIPYFVQAKHDEQRKSHIELYDNPYGNVWVSEYLHVLGFPVGSFTLETRYVTEHTPPFASAIQIIVCIKNDVVLVGNNSKKTYTAGTEEIIHTSLRTTSTNIRNDFPPNFEVQKEVVSEDGLQGIVLLRKTY